MTAAKFDSGTDSHRYRRRTPLSARGEPKIWLMGTAVVMCLALIAIIIVMIVYRGTRTFWPGPIHEIRLDDGSIVLGVPMENEGFEPVTESDREAVEQARNAGAPLGDAAWTEDGRPIRRRYFVGNRDLGQETFRWIPLWRVQSIEVPEDAVLIERQEWGAFLGRLTGVVRDSFVDPPPEGNVEPSSMVETPEGTRRVERALVSGPNGPVLRERVYLADVNDDVAAAIKRLQAEQADRWSRIDHLNLREAPGIEREIRLLQWRAKAARIAHERTIQASRPELPIWVWMLLLAGAIGLGAAGLRVRKDAPKRPYAQIGVAACWMVALLLGGAAYLERPGARADLSSDDLAKLEAGIDARIADLRNRQKAALDELAELQAEDRLLRVIATEPTHGRISPISRSEPDEPMMLSQVVRVVEANRLGTRGKLGVYFDRWWEYLSTPPRDGTSAGGVFPVIVGTVTLTILLTISVVPLGVIAALYLREYARQGLLTSCVRIAINNLAGVPSIVYGMFGLGFFCYMLGGYIDAGPAKPMALGSWWALWGAIALLSILSFALGVLGRKTTVVGPSRSGKLAGTLTLVTWTTVVSLAAWAVATTPYFNGFFEERLPEQPTFGGRGILWASLTLALLTLPVVIVATEEAIAAVPGSMREGSYGCGASKWQTMRRIVLPSAMPGIMTGAILAMARGAGEVAPLMLVGAVNLAPALPVSSEPPFLHGERTFMHLGFHIYTLGFQNPDSEATEPLVWTTALLLLTIVLVLNLAAIVLRARLRAKMRTSAV